MLNEKVSIEVQGRKLTVEMEGLTPLEIQSIANAVSNRMADIAKDSKVVDSSKLAILTALEFAADCARLQTRLDDLDRAEKQKVEAMIVSLSKALDRA